MFFSCCGLEQQFVWQQFVWQQLDNDCNFGEVADFDHPAMHFYLLII